MKHPLAFLAFCLIAAPASAQSVYVAVSGGSNTLLASHVEIADQSTDDSRGTAPFIGARVGIALGARWGVELDATQDFGVRTSQREDIGIDFAFGGLRPIPSIAIDTDTEATTFNPSVWIAQAVGNRVDLVFLAGVAFSRTEIEQELRFDAPGFTVSGLFNQPSAPFGIVPTRSVSALTPFPRSTETVIYDIGPLAGVDARIAFGTHIRVTPGLRLSGVGSGWSVRPAIAIGWMF
jgi:hypothetical protein